MEELENAGNRFRAALDEYLRVCSRMDNLVCRGSMPCNHSQECLNQINTEIAHFPSYRLRIREAEAAVSRIHNRSSQLAPIASLPPEILAYIFHLVAKPCDILEVKPEYWRKGASSSSEDSNADLEKYYGDLKLDNLPTHLDRVTHVCSYWRQIAINSPSLWTHIDFIPHKALHKWFLIRAGTYAVRSVGLPIEFHVSDSWPLMFDHPDFSNFLSSILSRIDSLDFVVTHSWRRFHDVILSEIFSHGVSKPSVLAKIKTSFTMADGELDEFVGWFDRNNNNHSSFTILHLQGLFPRWHSTAYHNLVDLRLFAPRNEYWTQIPELSLRNILASSPGLRIFHFALHITDRQPDGTSVIPVSLNDLEVLNIRTYRCQEDAVLMPHFILRLIAPGFKPLRLSIWHGIMELSYDDDNSIPLAELLEFFQRSNIAKFHAEFTCPQLDRLLLHAPNLKDLILDACVRGFRDIELLGGGTPSPSRLNSLTLSNCSPSLEQLGLLLQQHPTDLLLLCECEWDYIADSSEVRDPVGRIMELLERYPTTKLIMGLSNPVANWGLID